MRTPSRFGLVSVLLLAVVFSPAANAGGASAKCGADNGRDHLRSAPIKPRDLCFKGTPSEVRGAGPWTWQCQDSSGLQDTCFAAPGPLRVYANSPSLFIAKRIAGQLARARRSWQRKPALTFVLKFASGVYDFSRGGNKGAFCDPPGQCSGIPVIDVSGVAPGPKGRLLILGAGPAATTFVATPDEVQIFGKNAQRITVSGINFTGDRREASQGTEVAANVRPPGATPDWVGIDISPGFPQMEAYPTGLWAGNTGKGSGLYLRRYLRDPACAIDTSLRQVPYTGVVHDSLVPNRWWFQLTKPNPFRPQGGDLIGIKAKAGAGQAYFFAGSDDVIFDDIRWTRQSRGVFRAGTTNVQVLDSEIIPEGPVLGEPVCMAGSGGGPQFGQPNDPPTWGNVVDNFHAVNTGDDSIAVFNGYDANGQVGISISNSSIENSFARSINLFETPYDVPGGIDSWTLGHLSGCNSARPLTSVHEPSVSKTDSDPRFSECVLATE